MRRWSWLLGLLVIGVLGAVWWTSRNAIRMEPLDAQRFAQMSETEQVEWLIEQILARSKRIDTLTMLREKIPFLQSAQVSRPLTATDVDVIAAACIEYDLMHWLKQCELYVEFESDRERLRMYQAVLQARRGNWHAAERAVGRISTRPIRALALAHLGRLRAEAGQSEAAQHYFEQAYVLLSQLTDWTYVFDTHTALSLLTQLSHFGDDPDQLMQIVQRIPTNFQEEAVRRVAAVYRQRGDVERLSRVVAAAPRSGRRVARAKLVQTLIEQGRVEEGLKMLTQMQYCPAEQIVPIIHSIYQKGYINYAHKMAISLQNELENDFENLLPLMLQSSDAWLETPYGVVVVRISIEEQRRVLTQLARLYVEWGQEARAERLIEASPYHKRVGFAPLIHYALAIDYQRVGKHAQASQHLSRATAKMQEYHSLRQELAAKNTGPASIYATPEDYARAYSQALELIESGPLWAPPSDWFAMLSDFSGTYTMSKDYAHALEVVEQMFLADGQREGLVAILRGFVYRRQPLWRQLLETRP